MGESPLHIRLVDSIDYTRRDEITFGLMDVIKCSILLRSSETMFIFNDQFYDREAFDRHCLNENARNQRQMNSGYTNLCLKCPRTERNFPYNTALRTLFQNQPRREDIFNLILRRIGNLSTEEVDEFLPPFNERLRNISLACLNESIWGIHILLDSPLTLW